MSKQNARNKTTLELIRELIRPLIKKAVIWAEVTAVDEGEETCDLIEVGKGLEVFDVPYSLNKGTGIVEVPKVGARALIAMVENNDAEYVLLRCEAIEKIFLRTEDGNNIDLRGKETLLNGDAFGGLVKVDPAVQKLNALEQEINKLKVAIGAAPVVPTDGGASLKASLVGAWATPVAVTVKAELENPTVKHG